MRGDALEHVPQVQVRIDAVQTTGADQAVQARCRLPARIRAGEEVVATPEHERTDRALGGVIVDLDAAVLDVARECRPARQRVLDRPGERRFHRERTRASL